MNESTVFVFSGRDKFKPGLLCHAKHNIIKDLRMVNQSVNRENGRWTKSVQRNCVKYKWSFNLWF